MTITDLANQAVTAMFDSLDDLAERYGAEITDHIELVRALRWQVQHYKDKARDMQEMIDDLEETNDGLREDNCNLRAMVRTSYAKLFGTKQVEAA